jgi:hypothetical protein
VADNSPSDQLIQGYECYRDFVTILLWWDEESLRNGLHRLSPMRFSGSRRILMAGFDPTPFAS